MRLRLGSDATLELAAGDSASVTFGASTGMLKLDQPSTFSGEIFGFTGNGTLSGSDQIDLKGINYNTVQDSYANGILTVADGSGDTAKLNFNGSYVLANFAFASDGDGGTIVYDPPVSPSSTTTGPSISSATIGSGAALDLAASDTESVTFTGSIGTLILDGSGSAGQPLKFAGVVSGFSRTGCYRFTWHCFQCPDHSRLFAERQFNRRHAVARGWYPRCQCRSPGQLYGVEFCPGE